MYVCGMVTDLTQVHRCIRKEKLSGARAGVGSEASWVQLLTSQSTCWGPGLIT